MKENSKARKKHFRQNQFLKKKTKHMYRNASNKRPGRLLNFSDFKRGVYSREAFIRGDVL